MPSDFAIHSDLLVHWTGKDIEKKYKPKWEEQNTSKIPQEVDDAYLRRLHDILSFGFWMTKQPGWKLPDGSIVPNAFCLCFTELKLSQSRTHAIEYGRLGIAVKRPFLFARGGRPVIYYQPRSCKDAFLYSCSSDLKDKHLLQFFKQMDRCTGRHMKYDLYSESEWRIIAGAGQQRSNQIIDPRNTTNAQVIEYYNALSYKEQNILNYLVPLDGWLAAIIYPSLRIKNKAQQHGSEIHRLIRKIATTPNHARCVEGDNLPIELDLDLCINL
jgi:hypothetical protein